MNGWIRRVAIDRSPLTAPTAADRGHRDGDRRRNAATLPGEGHGDQGGRKREDAADAEVDAAGEDDEGHREGDDPDQGDLPEDVGEVAGLEERCGSRRRRPG